MSTSSLARGLVVPIPTKPEPLITNGVVSLAASFTLNESPVPVFVMLAARNVPVCTISNSVPLISDAVKLPAVLILPSECIPCIPTFSPAEYKSFATTASLQAAPSNVLPKLDMEMDGDGFLYLLPPTWGVNDNGVIGYGRFL